MDVLVLKQDRYAITGADGLQTFRIDITCSVTRDPNSQVTLTPDVFVYNTNTSAEADTSSGGSIDGNFVRVATISDLGTLPLSLADALATSSSEYRSSILQLSMPDLETAINAVPVVVDRVNSLVKDYVEYQNNFFSSLENSYSLPLTTDSSLVDRYSEAYSASIQARKSGQEDLESTQLEYSQLRAKSDILSSYKLELEDFSRVLAEAASVLNSIPSTVSAEDSASVVQSQYRITSARNLLQSLITNREALLSSLSAQESQVQSELKNKEQELSLLEEAEASALNELATYCPQVDPSSLD